MGVIHTPNELAREISSMYPFGVRSRKKKTFIDRFNRSKTEELSIVFRHSGVPLMRSIRILRDPTALLLLDLIPHDRQYSVPMLLGKMLKMPTRKPRSSVESELIDTVLYNMRRESRIDMSLSEKEQFDIARKRAIEAKMLFSTGVDYKRRLYQGINKLIRNRELEIDFRLTSDDDLGLINEKMQRVKRLIQANRMAKK